LPPQAQLHLPLINNAHRMPDDTVQSIRSIDLEQRGGSSSHGNKSKLLSKSMTAASLSINNYGNNVSS
jgi:hypothetical protein